MTREGIVRAAWRDLPAGKVVAGGSTVTRQLARNLYIGHDAKTIQLKLTQACPAAKLSQHRSKAWILQNFVNRAPAARTTTARADSPQQTPAALPPTLVPPPTPGPPPATTSAA